MDVAISNLEKKLQRLNSSGGLVEDATDKNDIPKAKDFKLKLERFSSSPSMDADDTIMKLKQNRLEPGTPRVERGTTLIKMANYDVERESTLQRISRDIMQKTPVKYELESVVQKKIEIINSPDYGSTHNNSFIWESQGNSSPVTKKAENGHMSGAKAPADATVRDKGKSVNKVDLPTPTPRKVKSGQDTMKDIVLVKATENGQRPNENSEDVSTSGQDARHEIVLVKAKTQSANPVGGMSKLAVENPSEDFKAFKLSPRKKLQSSLSSSVFTIGTFQSSTTQYSDVTKHF